MKRNIAKLGIAAVILVAGVFMALKPSEVYAENMCDGSNIAVNIRNGAAIYAEGVDQETAVWEESSKTLALKSYNGGTICFDDYGEVNLYLEGDNEISATYFSQINEHDTYTITINGSGSLTLKRPDNVRNWTPIDIDNLKIESGNIRILNESSGLTCRQSVASITGGSFYSECKVSSGDFGSFYQTGGTFEMKVEWESVDEPCLYESFVVIKGGVTAIDCAGAPAMAVSYPEMVEAYLPQVTVKTEGNVVWIDTMEEEIGVIPIPSRGAILFDGGDITLKSNVAALVAEIISEDAASFDTETFFAEKGKDFLITTSDDLTIDPDGAVIDSIPAIETERMYGIAIYSTFIDGVGETSISRNQDGSFNVSPNIAKELHFYKTAVPVPPTDEPEKEEEEEVPNTVDAKIVALAFGLLFAIIAEGAVIADLYRRLFGYKKEIAEVEKEELIDK